MKPVLPHFKHHVTYAVLPLEATMEMIRNNVTAVKVEGIHKPVNLSRLRQFSMFGCKCYNCGREGNAVLISKDKGGASHADVAHVNGLDAILMNRDHILPASKGGGNEPWNMRPACVKCNTGRGNRYTDADEKEHLFRKKWKKMHNKMWMPTNPFKRILGRLVNTKLQFRISRKAAEMWYCQDKRLIHPVV